MAIEKTVSAYLYPKRIIIMTRISNKYGSAFTETDCLSILQANVTDEELGVAVLRHIELSIVRELEQGEIFDLRKRYYQLAKFKTEGQRMKDAKLVSVYLSGDKIRFEPKNNRYSEVRRHYYEYQGIPDAKFSIDYPCSADNIGVALREAWEKCIIT